MAEGCRERYRIEDEGVPTRTTREQAIVEGSVVAIYQKLRDVEIGENIGFLKTRHALYLHRGIHTLPEEFECLDASQPWLVYWIAHSMRLLGITLTNKLVDDITDFLSRCQATSGGFGGGPGQLPHLAPTYAAILTLCSLGRESAYKIINRPALQRYLFSMRRDDGSFTMHEDGEIDVRGAYCAIVSALLTNIFSMELFSETAQWIANCQTYEGGFSAVPGTEAHGGYTYCGYAGLTLLGETHLCDSRRLLRWTCRKQMQVEGGFQGRTNKLVDGCYSFWQGGVFPLIYASLIEENKKDLLSDCWHFNQETLQEYILYCCQCQDGGLIDKPGKTPDFYHTCYCLSGLSVAQHCYDNHKIIDITSDPNSILKPTHPTFNIVTDQAQLAMEYFNKQPAPKLLHITS